MVSRQYKSCDPKYYDSKLHTCDNTIKGLDKLLDKIKKESDNGD
jgi:hypothetical protein